MKKEISRWKQDFFDLVQPIRLKDRLAYVLGAQNEGDEFIFHYTDAVMLAGHSCPAVSGAYKVTAKALKALYANETPVRGDIKVVIKGGPQDLAYGPQAQVISFITGASGITGFKGLGGRHSRCFKLYFDEKEPEFNAFVFQREDTLKAVKVTYNPQAIQQDQRMGSLIPLVLQGTATHDEKELFISLWQGNVKKILIDDEKYPGLFTVKELKDFRFPDELASRQSF